jgi:Pyridine nucleotide-disulphide oxidoreductase
VNCFERANIPGLLDEERENQLTFAVIGASPTGIEFAAELRDFIKEDGPKYYPNLLKHVRIKIIEAAPTVIAPFDKELQDEAVNLSKQISWRNRLLLSNDWLKRQLFGRDVSDLGPLVALSCLGATDAKKLPKKHFNLAKDIEHASFNMISSKCTDCK